MRQKQYTDGSPSREWEDTGIQEMEDLLEKVRPQDSSLSIVGVRDRLDKLRDVVWVCHIALTNKDWKGQELNETRVANVLYDYVELEIEKLSQELKQQ